MLSVKLVWPNYSSRPNTCIYYNYGTFMAFESQLTWTCSKSRSCGRSGIVVSPNMMLPRLKPVTCSPDTTCWIRPLTISFENQLVSSEGSQSLLWHSNTSLLGMSMWAERHCCIPQQYHAINRII